MINKKIARRYSQALYETAKPLNKLDAVLRDMKDIKNSIEGSRELDLFLKSPIIHSDKKADVINELFEGKVDVLTMKFLGIISKKGRENFLYDISSDMIDLSNEHAGILKADVVTAVELDETERKKITDKLKEYTGKQVEPTYRVDKTIKGGFIARLHDTIIDASIKRQLELLREQFRKGSFSN